MDSEKESRQPRRAARITARIGAGVMGALNLIGLAGAPDDFTTWVGWITIEWVRWLLLVMGVPIVGMWVFVEGLNWTVRRRKAAGLSTPSEEPPPPLGNDWISEDEVWARITLSSLLVESQHWHRKGSLFDRTTAGNERVRRLVHRFAWECPQAVRSDGEREFNLEVLLWWIAKEAESMPPLPTPDQLPPVAPLSPVAELRRLPKPGNKWVSLWDAGLDIRQSSLLDSRHRSDPEGVSLTNAGKERVEWLLYRFAEDCPHGVRQTDDGPEFNSKVLWWWIRAQAETATRRRPRL